MLKRLKQILGYQILDRPLLTPLVSRVHLPLIWPGYPQHGLQVPLQSPPEVYHQGQYHERIVH